MTVDNLQEELANANRGLDADVYIKVMNELSGLITLHKVVAVETMIVDGEVVATINAETKATHVEGE